MSPMDIVQHIFSASKNFRFKNYVEIHLGFESLGLSEIPGSLLTGMRKAH